MIDWKSCLYLACLIPSQTLSGFHPGKIELSELNNKYTVCLVNVSQSIVSFLLVLPRVLSVTEKDRGTCWLVSRTRNKGPMTMIACVFAGLRGVNREPGLKTATPRMGPICGQLPSMGVLKWVPYGEKLLCGAFMGATWLIWYCSAGSHIINNHTIWVPYGRYMTYMGLVS